MEEKLDEDTSEKYMKCIIMIILLKIQTKIIFGNHK